jgi:hypothetical protein
MGEQGWKSTSEVRRAFPMVKLPRFRANKSYHFGLLNGFKYWYRRMHDCRIVTVTCVGGDAIDGISTHTAVLLIAISNGTERQLMRAEKQFMRNMNNYANMNKGHIHIPLFLSEPYKESQKDHLCRNRAQMSSRENANTRHPQGAICWNLRSFCSSKKFFQRRDTDSKVFPMLGSLGPIWTDRSF